MSVSHTRLLQFLRSGKLVLISRPLCWQLLVPGTASQLPSPSVHTPCSLISSGLCRGGLSCCPACAPALFPAFLPHCASHCSGLPGRVGERPASCCFSAPTDTSGLPDSGVLKEKSSEVCSQFRLGGTDPLLCPVNLGPRKLFTRRLRGWGCQRPFNSGVVVVGVVRRLQLGSPILPECERKCTSGVLGKVALLG